MSLSALFSSMLNAMFGGQFNVGSGDSGFGSTGNAGGGGNGGGGFDFGS
ncbi:hypothetical protein [Prescottella subtropica]|nr:hypothetical protein [Prescottella subtropica]